MPCEGPSVNSGVVRVLGIAFDLFIGDFLNVPLDRDHQRVLYRAAKGSIIITRTESHRSRCDTDNLGNFMSGDKFQKGFEIHPFGCLFPAPQRSFETFIHTHGVLNVLSRYGQPGVACAYVHKMLNLQREEGFDQFNIP